MPNQDRQLERAYQRAYHRRLRIDLLGMLPGDTLVDVFPGTGIVSRAWAELSFGAGATTSSGSAATVVDLESATVVAARGTTTDASLAPEGDVVQTDRRLSSLTPASPTDASLVDVATEGTS